MIIATAGHIDHGKTVLVRALTGVDTDRLPEEKERGLSIDLGFAYQKFGSVGTVGFVDVPGHEKFVRNMWAGVTGIDFALLVIAADDGPMPQTEEHLAILDLLGIEFGAIALTKIDRVDAQRLSEVQEEITVLVADTTMENAPIFTCSALTGDGIPALKAYLYDAADRCAAAAKCIQPRATKEQQRGTREQRTHVVHQRRVKARRVPLEPTVSARDTCGGEKQRSKP